MTIPMGEPGTPAERRVQEAVRSLPHPQATPAFRTRLKRDFASGRIGTPRTIELASPRVAMRWLALAPAALVLLIAIVLANRAPALRAVAVNGEGFVIVGGRPVPAGHLAELNQRLTPGTKVELAGATLELESAGNLHLELVSGSAMTLPKPPGRWFGRVSRGRLERGEVRITTGQRFHGARLAMETPEVTVEVVGTTLAVIREPVGTCVCVLDGTVRVGEPGGEMEMVQGGRRKFVFNDGRPIERAEMRPVEQVELARFREHARD